MPTAPHAMAQTAADTVSVRIATLNRAHAHSSAGSLGLRVIALANDDFVHRRGKLPYSAFNVPEATQLDTVRTQNDHGRELLHVKLLRQLLVLHENVRCPFPRLVKVDFAQKEVVLGVVGKLGPVEYLPVEFETGNAPIGTKKCQQQRPGRFAGESDSRREIGIVTYIASESATAGHSRQIAADEVAADDAMSPGHLH